MTGPRRQGRRNGLMLSGLLVLVFGMVGLSFASVPLYRLFCQVTGFGGTTQVAEGAAETVLDRTIRVRFTADTNRNLPWTFSPETREMEVLVGQSGLVNYVAENLSDTPTAGTATYNVNPAKAGIYFSKIQCFCFQEQVLTPGQRIDMPVYFFVDPAIADDPALDDVTTITLSYTFFPAGSEALDNAVDAYYRDIEQSSLPAPAAPAGPEEKAEGPTKS
ncbi:MAG: cytochrome c oxidase assembly protein [Inquilinaceae bacterium]